MKKIDFNGFGTSFSTPSKKPDAKKQYKSMLEWADGPGKDLLGATDTEITLNAMHEYKLIDDETFKLVTTFLIGRDGDNRKMYNGVVLNIPDLEQGTSTFTHALRNWIDGLKGGNLTDPKFALGIVKRDWQASVQPVRTKMKQIAKMALKKQVYFSSKWVGQISDRLLKELDGKYKGFREGIKYRGWLMEGSGKLFKYLKGRLEDKFNVDSYSSALLENFMKEMPDLTENGELNLDAVFKNKHVSGIYTDLVKKYRRYLKHFLGEESRGERRKISEGISLTNEEFEKIWENPISEESARKLYEAEVNLEAHDYTIDGRGDIYDPDDKLVDLGGEDFEDVVLELSKELNKKKLKKLASLAKVDLEEKYGWTFDDDERAIYLPDGTKTDLKGHDYDEAVAELSSKIKEHGYEKFMRKWEEERRRKDRS